MLKYVKLYYVVVYIIKVYYFHFPAVAAVRLLTGDGPLTFIQKSLSLGRNHIRTFLGRPQDVGRTCPLELRIRPKEDVLIKYVGDVLKMLVEDVLSCYMKYNMGMSSRQYIGTSSGRW